MSTFQLHASWIAALEWGPIARRLCLAPMFLLSFGAQASQWCREPELNVFGLSAHFYETRYSARRSWNEFNFGLGLTCQLGGVGRWHDEAEVGVFRNSFRRTSFYGGYGIYYPLTPAISGGVRAVIASGYPHENSMGVQVGLMPALKVKLNESVTLNLLARPVYRPFFCVHLGIRL